MLYLLILEKSLPELQAIETFPAERLRAGVRGLRKTSSDGLANFSKNIRHTYQITHIFSGCADQFW